MGERLFEIHNDVLENLMEWNTSPQKEDQNMDYPFGLAVLLSLVPMSRIEAGEIDSNALAFLFGMYLLLKLISSIL